ncbi:MAG: endonuclease/exonuclease/phosphatase family protein [Clostridia bacterium]|nr:endonuclease/exonuclease/phosphatase family protein [Clostridia bacterium]
MKKLVIILLCLILVAIVAVTTFLGVTGYYSYQAYAETVPAPAVSADGSLVIMSANIRRQEKALWFNSTFWKFDTGSHRWYKRAQYYLKNIETVQPDILGAQEVQPGQYEFLTEHLIGYGSVVGYRDDKGARSESCPIFYNEARFTLLDSGTFWLSDTPDVMSKYDECSEYRIATFAKLRDKSTGVVIAVYNTHPDWSSVEARIKQLSVVAQKAQASEADKVVILGDLNSDRTLTGGNAGLAPLDAFLKDSKTFPGMTDYGATFNGYDIDPDGPMGLDYIFLPAESTVLAIGKVDTVYDGVYPSDHFPIWAKVKF